jgi:hypothetical protein
MALRDDFIKEAKKDNWTFSLKKSSLGPLIVTLGSPTPDINAVAKEVGQLSAKKKTKYAKALTWLSKRVPYQSVVTAHPGGIGLTDQSYLPGKEVRRKDEDNGWHTFEMQQKGNSCGCAAVRTVLKAFTSIELPTEERIRNDMSLYESGIAHQGVTKSNHDWENVGSVVPSLVSVLRSYGLREARTAVGPGDTVLNALRKCSSNTPGIIGWWWGAVGDTSLGGHWTVCVGPTRSGSKLVILDPWNGVQYVDVGSWTEYTTSDGAHGWFRPNDPSDAAVIVTYPR